MTDTWPLWLTVGVALLVLAVLWAALAALGFYLAGILERRIKARIERARSIRFIPPDGELLTGNRADR